MSTPIKTISGRSNRCCNFSVHRSVNEKKSSQRLLELSAKERYEALHDLHGVSDEVSETSDLVDRCLEEMEAELGRIALSDEGQHYRKAVDMSPSYVRAQRLRCLRARSFKVREAAKLMTNMFQLKSRLFGDEKLTKDLTVTDLEPKDVAYCETGYHQLLPYRDVVGRKILFSCGKLLQKIPVETTIRLLFILIMSLEEQDQKKGLVMLYYGLGQDSFNKEMPSQFAKAGECIPYRAVANHFVYDNPVLHKFMSIVEFAVSIFDLSRFRIQFGSHMEIQYYLQTFGIPKENFPASVGDGSLDLGALQQTVQSLTPEVTYSHRQAADTAHMSDSMKPGPNDVIMGRAARDSLGNMQLRRMLIEYSEQYDAATYRMEKMVVTQHILASIKDSGGRFLLQRKNDRVWEVVSDDTARRKIALGFRNLRRQVNNMPREQSSKRRAVG